jgi:hypothetical protein
MCAGHVASMGEKINGHKALRITLKKRYHLEELGRQEYNIKTDL